jgi:hypothetical protein
MAKQLLYRIGSNWQWLKDASNRRIVAEGYDEVKPILSTDYTDYADYL